MKFEVVVLVTWGMAVCVTVFLAFYGLTPPPLVFTSTRYGSGYSETAFRRLAIGTPTEEVRKALGPPLAEWTNADGRVTLRYSFRSRKTRYFKMRIIVLSNDVVSEKLSYVWD